MLTEGDNGEFYEDDDLYIFFGNKKFSSTKKTFDLENITFGKQVHEAELLNVDEIQNLGSVTLTSSSDGLNTQILNKKIGIYTADCVPCFLFDGSHLYSLHLGWRSLQKGLLDKVLFLSKNNLKIFIGPRIKHDSFEVGEEVVESFEEVLEEPRHCWSYLNNNGKYNISLEKIIRFKLKAFNINLICSNFNTATSDSHHSYRADKATDLRNISFAFLKNKV